MVQRRLIREKALTTGLYAEGWSCEHSVAATIVAKSSHSRRHTQEKAGRQTDGKSLRTSPLFEDDARVEEDEETERDDEDEDESGDDVAVVPVLVDGADADGDVDAVDVVELCVRKGNGQEGRGQQTRGHPHHRHQQQRLGAALRRVHFERVANGVIALEAHAQDDEDGGEAYHVLQKHRQLACNTETPGLRLTLYVHVTLARPAYKCRWDGGGFV